MNLPKLFQKKDEEPSGKVQKIETRKAARPQKVKKSEPARKVPKKSDAPRFTWVQTTRDYLREVVYELRKVVWPSRKETLGSTAVVLVIVALSGIFLGAVDVILSRLVRLFVG